MAQAGMGTQMRVLLQSVKAIRRELMIALIIFLVGTLFGWIVLGWSIAPVTWTSAAPAHLQTSYGNFYLKTVAFAAANNRVTAEEVQTLVVGRNDLIDRNWTIDDVIARVDSLSTEGNAADYQRLKDMLSIIKAQAGGGVAAPDAAGDNRVSLFGSLLPVLGVIVAVALVVFVSVVLIRRATQSAQAQAVVGPRGAPGVARGALVSEWPGETHAPLRQFDLNYVLGDDRFDISHAIETANGMFLGECGMGISESIGTPDPNKVTAFEVWLFDKNDIRTVTSVLMSDHAYNDPTLKSKLASKGDLVRAGPGALITLETATLRVRAKVIEMDYGSGPLPTNSYFQRLHVVMAAWPLGDSGVTQPADVLSMD
jgi:hypothetical protein